MAAKTKKSARVESISLAELTKRFMVHLDESGKSDGTRFSYSQELKLAQNELGAETQLSALTRNAIIAFNECARVTTLKSGKPKSQLSIDKTRRVLRQALSFAHANGLIENALVDAKKDLLATSDEPVIASDAKSDEPKKKRSRKEAITPEVAQPDAERVADEVEASLADSSAL